MSTSCYVRFPAPSAVDRPLVAFFTLVGVSKEMSKEMATSGLAKLAVAVCWLPFQLSGPISFAGTPWPLIAGVQNIVAVLLFFSERLG